MYICSLQCIHNTLYYEYDFCLLNDKNMFITFYFKKRNEFQKFYPKNGTYLLCMYIRKWGENMRWSLRWDDIRFISISIRNKYVFSLYCYCIWESERKRRMWLHFESYLFSESNQIHIFLLTILSFHWIQTWSVYGWRGQHYSITNMENNTRYTLRKNTFI